MSSNPLARDALPPASVASPAQKAFPRELRDAAQSTFEVSAAASTVRTYEATLRAIAPKVTLKLGSPVLPMCTKAQFFAFFGAVLLLGPESSSPASPQPGVRWNSVKLVKAAVACCHVARGGRAVFDGEWSPRTGFFRSGVKRKCIHSTVNKSPLLVSDVFELRRRAEASRF